MRLAAFDDIRLHYREEGDPDGAPIVFSGSLGCDLRLWEAVVARLPAGLRIIRYDTRGHGLSDAPDKDYHMGALVTDAERLLDRLGVTGAAFVGLSLGGLIAQGLAVKRPDLISALVLSNTAARIGTPETWHARIEAVRSGGVAALSDAVLKRWFSRPFRETPELALWRHMLERQPAAGYAGCCAAIAGADFRTPTAGLRLPTLAIAASDDGSTPPELVRETADLIPGARVHLIRAAGHLPCVESPADYAATLTDFLRETDHVRAR